MEDSKPYFPEEWQDDDRMNVMFSKFRDSRDVNPHSWDSKMKFWTTMITNELNHSKNLSFDAKTLPQRFRRKDRTPYCLDMVLQTMIRDGKIQSLAEFQSSCTAGWVSWGFNCLVKKPIVWTLGAVTGQGSGGEEKLTGDFVVVDIVKAKAEEVLECHYRNAEYSSTNHVLEFAMLKEQCREICPDEQALELVLMLLQKQRKVFVHDNGEQKIIRFASKDDKYATPINDVHLGILKLKKTEQQLNTDLMKIPAEMERCREDARFYLNKGLKNSAKNALRRKKTHEKRLHKTEQALDTIHGLLQQIREAESEKMILETYKHGVAAFKETISSNGLTVDAIDDTMADVQEAVDTHEEIADAISRPVDSTLDVSMSELEGELEEILAAAEKEKEEDAVTKALGGLSIQDSGLPDVPTFDPSSPTPGEKEALNGTFTLEDESTTPKVPMAY